MKASNQIQSHADLPKGVPETCRIPEAMKLLHCGYRHVQDLMYSGRLRYYKPTSRTVLINVDDIRAIFATPENAAVLQGGK